jgi:hypothetical protein
MTDLEFILTAIIWVVYGVFSGYQSDLSSSHDGKYIVCIIFAPLVLIYRILRGIFHPDNMN